MCFLSLRLRRGMAFPGGRDGAIPERSIKEWEFLYWVGCVGWGSFAMGVFVLRKYRRNEYLNVGNLVAFDI